VVINLVLTESVTDMICYPICYLFQYGSI